MTDVLLSPPGGFMQNWCRVIPKLVSILVIPVTLSSFALASMPAEAAGSLPSAKVCDDKTKPPSDAVTKGGCLAQDVRKGNCLACHLIAGGDIPGNIAPPLVTMQSRFPDKAKLRSQIWDSTVANPNSTMPPFGRHKIVSEKEIDDIVEFLLTL
jgi:sulfur-oxidizing protein SoxX